MRFHPVVPQRGTVPYGVQATGYEKAANGHPDSVTTYYLMIKSEGEGASAKKIDEAIDCLWEEAGEAWLDTNMILFHHTLEYQNKMSDFLTESSEAIETLHDHIWMVVLKVMEDAGKPMAGGLGIAMHLVDMLPTIPLHLSFQSAVPGLTGFTPEVYAAWPKSRMDILDFSHVPPPQSNQKAMHVLCEEIVKNACGTTDKVKAIQPRWLLSMANVSTIGVKAAEVGAGDGPSSSPRTCHSPVPCASRSPVVHASHSPVAHVSRSPVRRSQMRSPSPLQHPQSFSSSSSSSGSSSGLGSASGSSSSGSSRLGSSDESCVGSPAGSRTGSQAPSEGSSSSGSECSVGITQSSPSARR